MASNEQPDQEPEVKSPVVVSLVKGRQSLSRIRRELSDEELASPAVQRLLIDEIERLDRDCSDLQEYRNKYHTAYTEHRVLQERLKKSLAGEIISGVCFSLAGAAFGYAPTVWNQQLNGEIAVSFGVILMVTAIASRVVLR